MSLPALQRWVTEAKRAVYGTVGIDSLAGPRS